MGGEIIRQGDPTSHGGRVLEGSMADICHGKPIAHKGHKTYCPLCKGVFPIVEGVMTMTFYGNGVAVAGMRTACGAILLPTQFTDTVEGGGGLHVMPQVQPNGSDDERGIPVNKNLSSKPDQSTDDDIEQETFFSLVDEDNQPIDGFIYDLYVDGVLHTHATPFDKGSTVAIRNCTNTKLVSWLAHDSGAKS